MLSSYTAPFGRSDYVRIYPDYPTLKEAENVDHERTRRSTITIVVILGAVICSLLLMNTLLSHHHKHLHLFSVPNERLMQPCHSQDNIPKVIHTIVLQRHNLNVIHNVSSSVTRNKCKALYHVYGYIHRYWTLPSVERLIEGFYPDYISIWRSYTNDKTRMQVAKYFILHRYGGIYLDQSAPPDRCYNKALQMLNRKTAHQDTLLFSKDHHVDGKILACQPCSDFMWFSIKLLQEHHREVIPPFSNFFFQPNRDFLLYSIGKFKSSRMYQG